MPRNLQPTIVAPPSASLALGMLVFIPDYNAKDRTYKAMRFQYNPESVSRLRQGEWSSDRVRTASPIISKQDRTLLDGHRGGGLYAKSEVITFNLVFDASEAALREGTEAPNVLPELAFLEQVALGGDEPMKTETTRQVKTKPSVATKVSAPRPVAGNDKGGGATPAGKTKKKPTYTTQIHGTAPSELLLVLGPRTIPVVLTSLTIKEQRFNPAFEPVRAECECKFRVLEAQEVKNNKAAQVAFTELVRTRKAAARQAEVGDGDARIASIISSLERK